MADPQPEEIQPAAGVPAPTRLDHGPEPSTVDAPVRWSGSAAVPETSPKKPWWRREKLADEEEPTAGDLWATTPPVDPWADQDTPWDAFPPVDESTPPPIPPTRIEAPAPAKVEPPPVSKSQFTDRPTTPALPPRPANAPKISKKDRKRARNAQPQPPANRLPIQTRPPIGPPAPPSGPIIQGRRVPAPPPWAPQPANRPMPPPPRRKRRWGRRIALLSLLGVVCCCGVPFAWLQLPTARQFPVTAALPSSFADLQLRDTKAAEPDNFAGVYRDSRGKKVTVFGETGFRLNPGGDIRTQIEKAAADYDLTDVQTFDLGETGAHERCGVGRDNGTSVVVCAWADHGSVATVLLTRRSIIDSAELVARLRDEVLTPG